MPRGKQLSPKTRGKIEALHSVGHSVCQITAFVRHSRNTVHQCLQRFSHGSNEYEKRPGHGKATTIREDHRLKKSMMVHCRTAKHHHDCSRISWLMKPASRCQIEQSVVVSVRQESTLGGLEKTTANRKPSVLRLGWATTHTQWTLDNWKSVLFTDISQKSA